MPNKRIRIVLLIIFVLLVLFSIGCIDSEKKQTNGVIVTSPEVAEIIVALGGLDIIIARTEYCDYPQAMQEIESIGDFSSIDIERVIELKPKIIFTAAFEQQEFYDKMQAFNIEVVKVHSNSIEAYYQSIDMIAQKLDLTENLADLIASFKDKASTLELPAKSPKVYFEISPNLGTVTDNSFIGDLIVKAGGINIFGDIKQDFFIAKNEEIVHTNPDVIIALSYLTKEEIAQRRGWQDVSAVKLGNIYTVDDIDIDTVMRTIPRSSDALVKFNQWFLDYDKKQKN